MMNYNIGVGEYTISKCINNFSSMGCDRMFLIYITYRNTLGSNFILELILERKRKYIAVDLSDTYSPLKESSSLFKIKLKGTILTHNNQVFSRHRLSIIHHDF